MSKRQVTIAIDAMGGENSPFKVLKGAELFLQKEKKTKFIFFGNMHLIKNEDYSKVSRKFNDKFVDFINSSN